MTTLLHPDLAGVDALGRRWASMDLQPKSRHALETIQKMADGAVLGGPNGNRTPADVAAWIDCHEELEPLHKSVLTSWYLRRGSVSDAARRVGCSRATMYKRWNEALWVMKAQLKSRGFRP